MGCSSTVQLLLKGPHRTGRALVGSLAAAVWNGHAETVRLVLDNFGDEAVRATPASRWQKRVHIQVMRAATQGHSDVIRVLLNATPLGLLPTFAFLDSALYEAARTGQANVARAVLECFTSLSVRGFVSAMSVAMRRGHDDIVQMHIELIDGGNEAVVLSEVARGCSSNCLNKLLAFGLDPEARSDERGCTALHWAQADNAETLLNAVPAHRRAAYINVQNKHGDTALHWGWPARDELKKVQILLEHGADTAARNTKGQTAAAVWRARGGHDDIVALIERNMLSQSVTKSEPAAAQRRRM